MPFVHGHPRDTGWVVAHRRRPNDAEDGQLPLIVPPEYPDRGSAPDAPPDPPPVAPEAPPGP